MMDYRSMTIWELQQEQAKIEAELNRRSIAFWEEAKHLSAASDSSADTPRPSQEKP